MAAIPIPIPTCRKGRMVMARQRKRRDLVRERMVEYEVDGDAHARGEDERTGLEEGDWEIQSLPLCCVCDRLSKRSEEERKLTSQTCELLLIFVCEN
jgi:hypothetical protein